ncbi:hypothetical protein JAAARDRAFT_36773 [Jaapia argillacea MUCL 33604]|uniref:Uncharacterized protein n=1 Tax=Jaapia argillacea MUCL 33604 TaxID=933084 RepID=A0A067PQ86_9AGAM|nr:hypothetical protein JAAARDRAFT_36773 [Jaapia argillacea MUCL 33604]
MAPPMAPGEPRPAPKPQPIGNFPFIALITICILCFVFVLWRRASELKTVVSHQLKEWSRPEGRIRLSEDDGPPATEFLEDDYDEDDEGLNDDEPLADRAERLRLGKDLGVNVNHPQYQESPPMVPPK